MSHFPEREGQVLLVVDVQRDVVANAWRRETVIATIADLVARARIAEVPVVWVQHHDEGLEHGSEGWQIIDELIPAPGEALVDKAYGDAFVDTRLDDVLGSFGVDEVVLVGAQSDQCIRSTAFGALYRGYDLTLVGDAHTTDDTEFDGVALDAASLVAAVNYMVWSTGLPGVRPRVVPSADLVLDSRRTDADALIASELDDEADEDLEPPEPGFAVDPD